MSAKLSWLHYLELIKIEEEQKNNKSSVREFESGFIFTQKTDNYNYFQLFNSSIKYIDRKTIQRITGTSIPVIVMLNNNNINSNNYSTYRYDDYILKPINDKTIKDLLKKYYKKRNNNYISLIKSLFLNGFLGSIWS